jgi:hypothetical protein
VVWNALAFTLMSHVRKYFMRTPLAMKSIHGVYHWAASDVFAPTAKRSASASGRVAPSEQLERVTACMASRPGGPAPASVVGRLLLDRQHGAESERHSGWTGRYAAS